MSIPAQNLYPAYPTQAPTISIRTSNSRLSSNQSAAASGALIGAGAAGFWHVLSIPEIAQKAKVSKWLNSLQEYIKPGLDQVLKETDPEFSKMVKETLKLEKSLISPIHHFGIIALSLGVASGLGALISVGLNILTNKKAEAENPFATTQF